MRVGLDVSPLRQTRAGTARYVRALLTHAEVDYVRLVWGGGGRAAAAARDIAWYPMRLPMAATKAVVELLHCPTFRAPLRSRVPLVVTVHDLAVLRHPETFNRWTRAYSRLAVPRVVRAADRVIAVSEFTARELRDLGVDEGKIRVVPNGVEKPFVPEGPRAAGDYVLAVGTLEPRKNLARLGLAAQRMGFEVRLVGERGWGAAGLQGSGLRWLGRISDDELAALYRGAACFAYPSLYEGFGLPVIEAMACGAAVVTSAGGATEEVAGGAAVLVDPLDVASIAAGIDEALRRRSELRALSIERARRYEWRSTAEATAEVYRELAA